MKRKWNPGSGIPDYVSLHPGYVLFPVEPAAALRVRYAAADTAIRIIPVARALR
jgi:hypothetical protein